MNTDLGPPVRQGILCISHELLACLLNLPPTARIVDTCADRSFTHNQAMFKVEHDNLKTTLGGNIIPRIDAEISHAGAVALWDWTDMKEKTACAIPDKMAALLRKAAGHLHNLGEPESSGLTTELLEAANRLAPPPEPSNVVPPHLVPALLELAEKGALVGKAVPLPGELCRYEIRPPEAAPPVEEEQNPRNQLVIPPHLLTFKHDAPFYLPSELEPISSWLTARMDARGRPNDEEGWEDMLRRAAESVWQYGIVALWCPKAGPGEMYRLDPLNTGWADDGKGGICGVKVHKGGGEFVCLPTDEVKILQVRCWHGGEREIYVSPDVQPAPAVDKDAPGWTSFFGGVKATWTAEAATIGVPAGHPLREVADAISRKSAEEVDRRMMEGSEAAPTTEAPAPPAEDAPSPTIRFREFL